MVNFELSKEIQKDVFFVLSRVRDNTLKDEGDLRKRCALYLQRFHTWCFPVCNALPQSRQRRHTHLMSPSAALQTSAPCYSGTDPHTPKDYNRYRTSSVNYQMNKKLHSNCTQQSTIEFKIPRYCGVIWKVGYFSLRKRTCVIKNQMHMKKSNLMINYWTFWSAKTYFYIRSKKIELR